MTLGDIAQADNANGPDVAPTLHVVDFAARLRVTMRLQEAQENERFHFDIYRAARCVELLRIIEHLWLQIGPYLCWVVLQGPWSEHPHNTIAFRLRHHKELLKALHEKNGARADLAVAAEITDQRKSLSATADRLRLDLHRTAPSATCVPLLHLSVPF
jgi:DNA-binding GntR family transcriptional regulator